MIHTLIGIGLCAVLVVVFVLSYRHKEGGCTGTGDCASCHGVGHCTLPESHHE
jgi:hypothetical protein